MLTPRRHGWQRPLHPLQIVGTAIFCFLAVAFYAFLGLFLGSRAAEITVTTLFSVVCVSVVFLFVRCTAIDPTDKTRLRKKKKGSAKTQLNTWKILCEIVLRVFRRLERKILRRLIRRKYIDPFPGSDSDSLDPFLPFPMVLNLREDSDAMNPKSRDGDEEISFCPLCDFEVKKRSKHCRTCNRCVEEFDHHCRWLNNCVGKRNYTTFILLMIFVLLMLIMEAGTGIAIFVRCFTDKSGIEDELERKLFVKFPREVLATISVLLVLMTSYGSVALGQLFFFHIILIRKGIRTYDYIMAMKEENQSVELDLSDDEDSDFSSDESIDLDSPEKSSFVSRFICRGQAQIQNHRRLSIRIEGDRSPSPKPTNKPGFRVGIDPWKLIKLSKDKAVRAAEKARERIANQRPAVTMVDLGPLKPLPLETKRGPAEGGGPDTGPGSTPLLSRLVGGSSPPEGFSSPRRRFSSGSMASPSPQSKYRSNFDLKLTDVSRELETYISRQVLSSVLKEEGSQPSPR